MATINSFFTFKYFQHPEYHFSHDSVFLAREVYEFIKEHHLPYNKILDLCAGCGIVGMDFLFHLNKNNFISPAEIDFLEVQDIYFPYFTKNWKILKNLLAWDVNSCYLSLNYENIFSHQNLQGKYDLIICNPPFFRKGHGKMSPSSFKNRCRFFLDSDFKNLLGAIEFALASNGKALVLIRSLEQHGLNILDEIKDSTNGLTFRKISTLRGTTLFEFAKPLDL